MASRPPTIAMPATAIPAEARLTLPRSASQATSSSVAASTAPMTRFAVRER